MRSILLPLVLASLCSFAAAQTTTTKSQRTAPPAPQTQPATPALSDADVQALRADIARMKSTLAQMQNNLAFVTNMQDPLKHQFQLEFEMWNVVIGDMQRRLDAAEKK